MFHFEDEAQGERIILGDNVFGIDRARLNGRRQEIALQAAGVEAPAVPRPDARVVLLLATFAVLVIATKASY